jgi:hypothetical protein
MKQFFLFAFLLLLVAPLAAQKKEKKPKEEIPDGWRFGAGIGLDLSQLLQINPKQGAGQNRLGLGGAANAFSNFKEGRRVWDNTVLWQFGIQRLGSGAVFPGSDDKIPFQKTIDEFRLNSKYGYQIRKEGELYYSVSATFLSQLTPTYQFADLQSGNFVSDFLDTGRSPLSKFLSPATATLSVGIDYKPTQRLSIFFSPIASKFIIVASDSIASRGVHGNEVSGEPDALGVYPEFDNVDAQIGATAQFQYKAALLSNDRLVYTGTLHLYTNYLRNPENVDVDWQNGLAFAITENLQLNLLVNVFYDDDILVQITDYSQPNGVAGLGKRVSFTQQLTVTYARTF